jgi:hypothetical protein
MHACTLVRRSGTVEEAEEEEEEEEEGLFKAKAMNEGDAGRVLSKDNACDLLDCFAILVCVVLCCALQ